MTDENWMLAGFVMALISLCLSLHTRYVLLAGELDVEVVEVVSYDKWKEGLRD